MDKRLIKILPLVFILGDQVGVLRTKLRVRRLIKVVNRELDTVELAWTATYKVLEKLGEGQDPIDVQNWYNEQKQFIDTVRKVI